MDSSWLCHTSLGRLGFPADCQSALKGEVTMVALTIHLRSVEGVGAAMGWAGEYSIVVNRPAGKAGGISSCHRSAFAGCLNCQQRNFRFFGVNPTYRRAACFV